MKKRSKCIFREYTENNKRILLKLSRGVDSGGRPGGARKTLFQSITREMNGAGKRKRLPKCVEDGVRKLLPSENGQYMGYKDK